MLLTYRPWNTAAVRASRKLLITRGNVPHNDDYAKRNQQKVATRSLSSCSMIRNSGTSFGSPGIVQA
jgi:hypothetical protein